MKHLINFVCDDVTHKCYYVSTVVFIDFFIETMIFKCVDISTHQGDLHFDIDYTALYQERYKLTETVKAAFRHFEIVNNIEDYIEEDKQND